MSNQLSGTAFFAKTYDDALGLLVEVRDYLEAYQPIQEQQMEPSVRLALTCLTMRLTAQLTDIMAWLLVQKAVHTGEMSDEEGMKNQNQLKKWLDYDPTISAELPIPPQLDSLLLRSRNLFDRVERLDVMIQQKQV
jgi:regulator of CtrA degradation